MFGCIRLDVSFERLMVFGWLTVHIHIFRDEMKWNDDFVWVHGFYLVFELHKVTCEWNLVCNRFETDRIVGISSYFFSTEISEMSLQLAQTNSTVYGYGVYTHSIFLKHFIPHNVSIKTKRTTLKPIHTKYQSNFITSNRSKFRQWLYET